MRFEQTDGQNTTVPPRGEMTDEQLVLHLQETLGIIDESMQAPDFNRADQTEILRSREFFEKQYRTLVKVGGSAVGSTKSP